MSDGTRGARTLARRSAATAFIAALVGLVPAACGGRSQAGIGGDGIGSTEAMSPGFLFACESLCAEGLTCLEGTCSLACEDDDECQALAPQASCVRNRPGRSSAQCALACGSDDGCASLGAGSYCGGAFCVAAPLDRLPSAFDTLELARRLEGARRIAGSECDPAVFATKLELNRATRRLSTTSCERAPGTDGYILERSRRFLGDAELDLVQKAYRALRLASESRCEGGTDIFSLDLQPSSGPRLLFADDDHAACPGLGTPHLSSSLDNLEELYELLLRLGTGE